MISPPSITSSQVKAPGSYELDAVDIVLGEQSGRIDRSRGANCRHGAKQRCSHCLPLDPFDEEYLKDKDIKHLSFHAYIRKLTGGKVTWGRGSKLSYPLENLRCHVKPNCPDHKPYPKGICTKCRPSTVTLARQQFRHVDNISFENAQLADRFLDYWRRTGHQRAGVLIGRYEQHPDVPLGIRAVVYAIYEPPQLTSSEGFELQWPDEDPKYETMVKMCTFMDMKPVGWVFTDLLPATGRKAGEVVECTRGADTYLMSAEECVTAARLQNAHPNGSRMADEGKFGSKFVTVIVTGDEQRQIHFNGYQVSNQCMSLVEDDLLLPVIAHPDLAYLRDDAHALSETHFIPDVKYTEKDKWGNDVTKNGRPLPVEYLMVQLPAGMPKEPQSFFYNDTSSSRTPFPIEGRELINELQNAHAVFAHAHQFGSEPDECLRMLCDFHLLLYLATNHHTAIAVDDMKPLLKAIAAGDAKAVQEWTRSNESWSSIVAVGAADVGGAASAGGGAVASGGGPSAPAVATWSCAHCTFANVTNDPNCSMCGLPRQ